MKVQDIADVLFPLRAAGGAEREVVFPASTRNSPQSSPKTNATSEEFH